MPEIWMGWVSNVGAGLLAIRSLRSVNQTAATESRASPLLHLKLRQLALAIISFDGLAASRQMATNLEVGVWLPSPVLSSGTSGLTSG
ncbi:hypothetical protein SAMN04490201_0413 [Pseudomonas psychrophila]|uniref:Secreted protein n=2 Tax=Pseudomonas psychrophila TaxID=122355 RepID=A0ABY0VEM1_9PSED|nr:hypothetical protein SAMN04490201_0413 [Pseudomonas psychrophila]